MPPVYRAGSLVVDLVGGRRNGGSSVASGRVWYHGGKGAGAFGQGYQLEAHREHTGYLVSLPALNIEADSDIPGVCGQCTAGPRLIGSSQGGACSSTWSAPRSCQ